MSSLRAKTKKAAEPPNTENGRITIARQHRKVDNIRAISRRVICWSAWRISVDFIAESTLNEPMHRLHTLY
jgi:hypothetical protein